MSNSRTVPLQNPAQDRLASASKDALEHLPSDFSRPAFEVLGQAGMREDQMPVWYRGETFCFDGEAPVDPLAPDKRRIAAPLVVWWRRSVRRVLQQIAGNPDMIAKVIEALPPPEALSPMKASGFTRNGRATLVRDDAALDAWQEKFRKPPVFLWCLIHKWEYLTGLKDMPVVPDYPKGGLSAENCVEAAPETAAELFDALQQCFDDNGNMPPAVENMRVFKSRLTTGIHFDLTTRPAEIIDRTEAALGWVQDNLATTAENDVAGKQLDPQHMFDGRLLLIGALLAYHKHGQGKKYFVRAAATAESLAEGLRLKDSAWTTERVLETFAFLPDDSYEAYRQHCEHRKVGMWLIRCKRIKAHPDTPATGAGWSVYWMRRAVGPEKLGGEILRDIYRVGHKHNLDLPKFETFRAAVKRDGYRKNNTGKWEKCCQPHSSTVQPPAKKTRAARGLPARARPPTQPPARMTECACNEKFEPYECPECGKTITDRCLECHLDFTHNLRPGYIPDA